MVDGSSGAEAFAAFEDYVAELKLTPGAFARFCTEYCLAAHTDTFTYGAENPQVYLQDEEVILDNRKQHLIEAHCKSGVS